MTLATMVANTNQLTKEERLAIENELIDDLLYFKTQWGRKGIDFDHINNKHYWRIGIFNPWDLFEFCNVHNIYLKIKRHPNYDANNTYYYTYSGIKPRTITINTVE